MTVFVLIEGFYSIFTVTVNTADGTKQIKAGGKKSKFGFIF